MENLELQSTITEIKYSLDGLNSRIEITEGRVCEPEARSGEIRQSEQQRIKSLNWICCRDYKYPISI